jgi:cell division protein FtsB
MTPTFARFRWDRLGRISLLAVLAVVAALYIQDAVSYFSTRAQVDQQAAVVQHLMRANAALERESRSLQNPSTIVHIARSLGMIRLGERPYRITGLAPGG